MGRKLKSFKEYFEEKNGPSLEEIEALEEKIDIEDTKRVLKIYEKHPERFLQFEDFVKIWRG